MVILLKLVVPEPDIIVLPGTVNVILVNEVPPVAVVKSTVPLLVKQVPPSPPLTSKVLVLPFVFNVVPKLPM